MKFLIVTPSFNRGTYLDDTIRSVVYQKGNFEIEYIIQDGGSSREVIGIMEKWERFTASDSFEPLCRGVVLKWYSEKDSGMYDAIQRGFARGSGDILAWINTDDVYHPGAFAAVSQVFEKFPDVEWLTGIPNSTNGFGSTVGYDSFPPAYSRYYVQRGLYDSANLQYGFNWIPQDCCFWRDSLWRKAGSSVDLSKRYAADFFLWNKFSQYADLVKINCFTGSYRFHGDQITATPHKYNDELPSGRALSFRERMFIRLLKKHGCFRKLIFNKRRGFPFVQLFNVKWGWFAGRTVVWSHEEGEWRLVVRNIVKD